MRPTLSRMSKRALGITFALSLLSGGLATAASPAGDVFDVDFSFRDELGKTAVLAVYDAGPDPVHLDRFVVRGPRVEWPDWHPLHKGTVKWQVIIKVATTPGGPWTIDRRTGYRFILANDSGAMETFARRTVEFADRDGQARVRVISRLVWVNEDGGTMGWVRHVYDEYGLVESDGSPAFGDQTETRHGSAPNRWNP